MDLKKLAKHLCFCVSLVPPTIHLNSHYDIQLQSFSFEFHYARSNLRQNYVPSSIIPSVSPLHWVKSTQFFHLDREAYFICSCFPPQYLCLNFHSSSTSFSQSHYVRVTPHFQFPWYLIISRHSSYLVRMNQVSSYLIHASSFCMSVFICQRFWKTVRYLRLGTTC